MKPIDRVSSASAVINPDIFKTVQVFDLERCDFLPPTLNVWLEEGAYAPERAHSTDAGMDIRSRHDAVIYPHCSEVFHTGVHIQLPHNTSGEFYPKSGLNMKHDLLGFGLIDEGYTGEIVAKIYNLGELPYAVHKGDKITQLVIRPVLYTPVNIVEGFTEKTERGDGGFGSTGR